MYRFSGIAATLFLTSSLATGQGIQPGDLVLTYPDSSNSSLASTAFDGFVNHVVTSTSDSWISSARMPDGRIVVHNNASDVHLAFYTSSGAYLDKKTIQISNYSSDIDVFSDGVIGVCSRGEGILLFDDQGNQLGALNPVGMQSAMGCKVLDDDTIWVADLASWPGNTDGKIWHLDRAGNVLHTFDTSFDPSDVDIAPNETVWVSGMSGEIVHFDVHGTLLGQFPAQIDSSLKTLWSLAVGDDSLIWASGHYDSKVRGYDQQGNVVYTYDTGQPGNSTFTYILPGLGWPETYCSGDGSAHVCPCGNAAAAGEGCRNSSGSGANLLITGSNDAMADDLQLIAKQLPAFRPALAIVGDQQAAGGNGTPFGDGLSCLAGSMRNLGVVFSDSQGLASWGPGLRAIGAWAPADIRQYQVRYRDTAGGPCASGFNSTNAIQVTFRP